MPWAKRPIFEWIAIFSGPKHQLLRTIQPDLGIHRENNRNSPGEQQ
jgi:hypothetical protein